MIYNNKLIVRGWSLDVLQFLKKACGRQPNGCYYLDFAKIIPPQKKPSDFLQVDPTLKNTTDAIDAYLNGHVNALRHLSNGVLERLNVDIMDNDVPVVVRVQAILNSYPNWEEAINDESKRQQNMAMHGYRSYNDYVAGQWGGCIPAAVSKDTPLMSMVRSNGRDGSGCLGVLLIFHTQNVHAQPIVEAIANEYPVEVKLSSREVVLDGDYDCLDHDKDPQLRMILRKMFREQLNR